MSLEENNTDVIDDVELREKLGVSDLEGAKDTISLFIVFGLIVVLCYKLYLFQLNISDTDYTFFNLFETNGWVINLTDTFEISASTLLFSFFIIHYLRMYVGMTFVSNDVSFRKAIVKFNESKKVRIAKLKIETLLRGFLLFTLSLTTLFISNAGPLGVLVLLLLQVVTIILYDRLYWSELVHYDEDRNVNRLLFINDFLFIFIVGLCFLYYRTDDFFINPTIFIWGAISSSLTLFGFEIVKLYKDSIKDAYNFILDSICDFFMLGEYIDEYIDNK